MIVLLNYKTVCTVGAFQFLPDQFFVLRQIRFILCAADCPLSLLLRTHFFAPDLMSRADPKIVLSNLKWVWWGLSRSRQDNLFASFIYLLNKLWQEDMAGVCMWNFHDNGTLCSVEKRCGSGTIHAIRKNYYTYWQRDIIESAAFRNLIHMHINTE